LWAVGLKKIDGNIILIFDVFDVTVLGAGDHRVVECQATATVATRAQDTELQDIERLYMPVRWKPQKEALEERCWQEYAAKHPTTPKTVQAMNDAISQLNTQAIQACSRTPHVLFVSPFFVSSWAPSLTGLGRGKRP
jgi:hypothetical protein